MFGKELSSDNILYGLCMNYVARLNSSAYYHVDELHEPFSLAQQLTSLIS